jgi:formate dehydrogenase major subunit
MLAREKRRQAMKAATSLRSLPLLEQLRGDPLGLGRAAQSAHSRDLRPRTDGAERVVKSVCPYCSVGCGQRVFVKDGAVTQIEGDPDSPISRGRLCPKGSATRHYATSPLREYRVRYRRPYGTRWEELSLDRAMDMIAERVIQTRRETWEDVDEQGRTLRRTLGIASLGGATLDNAAGAVTMLRLGRQRGGAVGAGALLLAGSLAERFAIFRAGLESARDPRYTIVPQRQRVDQRAATRRTTAS